MGGRGAGGVSTSHTGLRIVQQLWASESQCCLPLSHSAFQSGRFEFARHYHRTPMPPPPLVLLCLLCARPPRRPTLTGRENAGARASEQPASGQQRLGDKRKHHMKIFPVKADKICVHVAASEKFPNKQFRRLGEFTR